MIPDWVAAYIGLPFQEKGRDRTGLDCYGLVRLIYTELYGIELPSYSDEYKDTRDTQGMVRLVQKIAHRWERIDEPQEGDVIVLKCIFGPHAGVVVAPGIMVHAERGVQSNWDRYTDPMWSKRIVGFYHHEAKNGKPAPA
jgi:cell wall-associated NlpC family hydrolase